MRDKAYFLFFITYPLRESHTILYLTSELSTTSHLKPLAGRTISQGKLPMLTKNALCNCKVFTQFFLFPIMLLFYKNLSNILEKFHINCVQSQLYASGPKKTMNLSQVSINLILFFPNNIYLSHGGGGKRSKSVQTSLSSLLTVKKTKKPGFICTNGTI